MDKSQEKGARYSDSLIPQKNALTYQEVADEFAKALVEEIAQNDQLVETLNENQQDIPSWDLVAAYILVRYQGHFTAFAGMEDCSLSGAYPEIPQKLSELQTDEPLLEICVRAAQRFDAQKQSGEKREDGISMDKVFREMSRELLHARACFQHIMMTVDDYNTSHWEMTHYVASKILIENRDRVVRNQTAAFGLQFMEHIGFPLQGWVVGTYAKGSEWKGVRPDKVVIQEGKPSLSIYIGEDESAVSQWAEFSLQDPLKPNHMAINTGDITPEKIKEFIGKACQKKLGLDVEKYEGNFGRLFFDAIVIMREKDLKKTAQKMRQDAKITILQNLDHWKHYAEKTGCSPQFKKAMEKAADDLAQTKEASIFGVYYPGIKAKTDYLKK